MTISFIKDINYESMTYGLEKWADPYYWYMYKYALCVPAIPYLSFNFTNIIKSLYGIKKGLFLDLEIPYVGLLEMLVWIILK
jgi:hypothetical protein